MAWTQREVEHIAWVQVDMDRRNYEDARAGYSRTVPAATKAQLQDLAAHFSKQTRAQLFALISGD